MITIAVCVAWSVVVVSYIIAHADHRLAQN